MKLDKPLKRLKLRFKTDQPRIALNSPFPVFIICQKKKQVFSGGQWHHPEFQFNPIFFQTQCLVFNQNKKACKKEKIEK